jgi:SAM-dependent methyltransferase
MNFRQTRNDIGKKLVETFPLLIPLRSTLFRKARAMEPSSLLDDFYQHCLGYDSPRVMELGTRVQTGQKKTRRSHWVPQAMEYIGVDYLEGDDVDIVADVHRLSETFSDESFDIIISGSTFEHFKYPHLAAHEMLKVLEIGGALYLQTHQSFPLHGSPHDYFRFSREALRSLFGTMMGFEIRDAQHEYASQVVSGKDKDAKNGEAYLNSAIWGIKTGPTPAEYIYELDTP